jgi:hypothetical protein
MYDGDDVTLNNVLLTFGDVKLAGTAEFALVTRSVLLMWMDQGSAALLTNGQLTSLALTVTGSACMWATSRTSRFGATGLATLKSATPLVDGRSYTALKMGNVVVGVT